MNAIMSLLPKLLTLGCDKRHVLYYTSQDYDLKVPLVKTRYHVYVSSYLIGQECHVISLFFQSDQVLMHVTSSWMNEQLYSQLKRRSR